jgi:hypothetical protein
LVSVFVFWKLYQINISARFGSCQTRHFKYDA